MPRDDVHLNTSGLKYRPDIDGLRAVAVVPVVLYHAGVPYFHGGFVGVDVFFVISGYLITSLLLADIQQGNFSILKFYERRIRRIFPALFAVITACGAAAWFVFMPREFSDFAKSTVAAALFSSNMLFWSESGYFDTEALVKPLLHTWSLAVEEQFYVFFPLLLAIISKAGIRKAPFIMGSLWLLSLGLSIWAQIHAPAFNFYWSPPRFWELLTGALLALGILPTATGHLCRKLVLVGITMIAAAVFIYDEATPFPGVAALLPCLGTALVIYGGERPARSNVFLTSQPVVFIGLISYSLYLWHWPIIVFMRYLFAGDPSPSVVASIICASFIVATMSWHWIEQPFRGKQLLATQHQIFSGAAIAIAAASGFGIVVVMLNGLLFRLPVAAQAAYAASRDISHYSSSECFSSQEDQSPSTEIKPQDLCRLGAQLGKKIDFLVWGDSHAAALAPALDVVAERFGRTGLFLGRGSCPPLLDFDTGGSKRQKIEFCKQHNEAVLRFIAENRIPSLFLVARWPKYSHRSEFGNEGIFFNPKEPVNLDDHSKPLAMSLDTTLEKLTSAGAKPVLVMDVPEIGYNVPYTLAKAIMTGAKIQIAPESAIVVQRQALAVRTLKAAATRYNAVFIDPTPRLCDSDFCRIISDGTVLYADEDHLSQSGAKFVSPIFDAFFSVPKNFEARI